MTGGGGRSRSKRDTPEPDTPIREKMPIAEAGESFPQLVDSSVEFSPPVGWVNTPGWEKRVFRRGARPPAGVTSAAPRPPGLLPCVFRPGCGKTHHGPCLAPYAHLD